MSAPRPRPVTATFKPPSMAPPTGVCTRSYSLSSGSSTASLVSILNHDSYESLPESVDCSGYGDAGMDSQKLQQQKESEHPPPSSANDLTPWEQWRLRKVKEELKLKEEEDKKQAEEKQEEERKRKEKAEIDRKSSEKYKEWLDMKCVQLQTVRKQEARRSITKAEIEAEKKAEIQRKAQEKYNDWMAEKKKKQAEAKKLETEKKKKDEEEKEVRRKRADEKYNEWCKQAQRRPKSSHSSLGYAGGKLTGYYDKTALPAPSYCNPIPWQPIPMPPEPKALKPKKGQKKKKLQWNPMKYL